MEIFQRPVIAAGVFVAPNASVIGQVMLLNHVSVIRNLPLKFVAIIITNRSGMEPSFEVIRAALKWAICLTSRTER